MHTPSESSPRSGVTLRWIIFIVIGLVLFVALFYGEENFRGKRAWANFKRAQAAEGEKLGLADFIPPPVADEQNFAMTPLLRPVLDYVQSTNGIQWRDTNAYQHLSSIRIDVGSGGAAAPRMTDLEQGAPVDLKAFADFYHGNTNYPQSAHPENAAEVVLTALNKFAPDLEELREAAAARPYSRFPIHYDHEPPSGILLPHLASVKGLTMVCDLRAIAELESRRSAEALADLEIGFRLSASIRDEPILIDHLVRIASLELTLRGIREGLNRHAWSDSQLAEIETNLAGIDLLGEYEHTMRGERALNIAGIDFFRRQGLDVQELGGSVERFGAAARAMPSGWYYQNMVLVGESYRDYLLPTIDASNRVVTPAIGDEMLRDLSARPMGPYNIFAKLMLPALAKAGQRTARAQTFLDETRVACAIERYRMQHHELPDQLSALTPQFLSKIPNDLFDGQPLRYKTNANGGYILYSIGWNEIDDGGVAAEAPGNAHRTNPNEGDWVWESPAK